MYYRENVCLMIIVITIMYLKTKEKQKQQNNQLLRTILQCYRFRIENGIRKIIDTITNPIQRLIYNPIINKPSTVRLANKYFIEI